MLEQGHENKNTQTLLMIVELVARIFEYFITCPTLLAASTRSWVCRICEGTLRKVDGSAACG